MASGTDASSDEIAARILRFDDLIPCKTAFIDARTPGSDKKENFCLIGDGVAENPGQVVHIKIPHGFDIGAARQPKGCKNSHHSHETEEVFVVNRGAWKFTWGHDGTDGEAVLHEGDTISIPTEVFRGFENVGPDDGFLFAVLGLNRDGSAGHVTWAPYVFENARSHGLVLLEDGRLIDTAAGDAMPADGKEITPTSLDGLENFRQLSVGDMLKCVLPHDDLGAAPEGELSKFEGVRECAVIGTANDKEGIGAGKMGWPHSFQLRRLQLQPGTTVPAHSRAEEEVLFVQSGTLEITTPEATIVLEKGDLFTTPIGLEHGFGNTGNVPVDVIVVRGGSAPEAATF